ncbi:5'/3'-nucleotidase SurE [Salinibacterium sp. dk2585]|uniref:5'/3'-nucleotidase SurE n=1 Tax=unclassified Salinibacterium TaxID=2632331 RepID=UPI0011C2550F|nr:MULTISPECIES: 5'/3'-nucleotidase SurE [unclassified Salinibacterium]QEE61864.1 5'/3'-nucleotidase SurE [Salinibacterium sp. dk2585]TXK54581.1 5'/3'-nucleotidase SurE [Salinibacterium sp. dk5596]
MTTALITNDDGIDSPGLHRLARMAIESGLDVVIAGPSEQSSGSSASILGANADGRVPYSRHELEGFDIPVFAVDAAPALISLIAAHGAFGFVPDIVFSGVNRGANVGHAILHSGTVGAALTAGVNGARGLAVSLDVGMDPDACLWDAAAPHVSHLVPLLLAQQPGTVFNLNVPNVDTKTELREGPLAAFGIVQTLTAVGGDDDVRLEVSDTPADQEEGSDAALLRAGYATVTNITGVREASVAVLAN